MIEGNRILFFAIPFGVVFVSWFLMRTLLLPRVGCWLFYFSTLTALFCILVLGLALVGTAALGNRLSKTLPRSPQGIPVRGFRPLEIVPCVPELTGAALLSDFQLIDNSA
jgi:hypothetical protein